MNNDFDFEHICEKKRSRCTEEVGDLRLLDNRLTNSRTIHAASELSKTVPVDRTLGVYPYPCERKADASNFNPTFQKEIRNDF